MIQNRIIRHLVLFFRQAWVNIYYVPDGSFVHLAIGSDYIGEGVLTITVIDDSRASSSKPYASQGRLSPKSYSLQTMQETL